MAWWPSSSRRCAFPRNELRISGLLQAAVIALVLGFWLRDATETSWWPYFAAGYAVLASVVPWVSGGYTHGEFSPRLSLILGVVFALPMTIGAELLDETVYRDIGLAFWAMVAWWGLHLGASLLGVEGPAPIGPRPPEWNKTLAELNAEKRSLSGAEIQWAREYEREQLKSWARFPRDGEEFAAKEETKVNFLVYWKAPYTTSGEGLLAKGARIRVHVHPQDPEPIGVQAYPLDIEEFEKRFVPESDRQNAKYNGYCIALDVSDLNRKFDRMEPSTA